MSLHAPQKAERPTLPRLLGFKFPFILATLLLVGIAAAVAVIRSEDSAQMNRVWVEGYDSGFAAGKYAGNRKTPIPTETELNQEARAFAAGAGLEGNVLARGERAFKAGYKAGYKEVRKAW